MIEIYDQGLKILEPEIVKKLLPDLTSEEVNLGIVKKQTDAGPQRRFRAIIAVGNRDGWFGVGEGKAPERFAATQKATSTALLSIIPVQRDSSNNSIPFKTVGKSGSVMVQLSPAAKGTGIVAGPALKKLIRLAGVRDVYVRSFGSTSTASSLANAVYDAFKKSYAINVNPRDGFRGR